MFSFSFSLRCVGMLRCTHCPGRKSTVNLDQLEHRYVGARVCVCVCVWVCSPSRVLQPPITQLTQDNREKRREEKILSFGTQDAGWERAERIRYRERKHRIRWRRQKMNRSQWQKDVTETGEVEGWRGISKDSSRSGGGGVHCLMQATELYMIFM